MTLKNLMESQKKAHDEKKKSREIPSQADGDSYSLFAPAYAQTKGLDGEWRGKPANSFMSILDYKKILFLLAHPDDDAFISGTIWTLLQKGADISCVWLTSGDFFGQGTRREKEIGKAARILGLSSSRIHLFRLPDLGLVRKMERATTLLSEILLSTKPDAIFTTAYEGGHPDHDAANLVAAETCSRLELKSQLLEFPLYNGSGPLKHWRWKINSFPSGWPDAQYQVLTKQALRIKYRVMMTYSSQWMYMIPAGLASLSSRMLKIGEPFRAFPRDRDYTVPPHAGRLNYERWFNSLMKTKFSDFRTQAMSVRSRSTQAAGDNDTKRQ
jgi:LmbE family N-acetylglucosaminyl deacetylase